MDGHPPKTPATLVGEPMLQAHVRVSDMVNRRKSGRRRRRSVEHSRRAEGTAFDERALSLSPRDRDISVDSRTSSLATSTSTTTSRVSMVSAPPRPTPLQRQGSGGDHRLGARRYDAAGDRGRRRRVSFDEGPPRAEAAAAAVAAAETLSVLSTSSTVLSSSSTTTMTSTRCAVCLADFTRYRRPHRCRTCRKAVCATCSPARRPKRTCKLCDAGGSAAPRVIATVSPPRQAAVVVVSHSQTTGAARTAAGRRRSVGSSARVLVAAPLKPAAVVVAAATYPATASADEPKEVVTPALEAPAPAAPNSADSCAGVINEELKASGAVDGTDDREENDGPGDFLGGAGAVELEEEPTRRPAGSHGNKEVEGFLGRLDVEVVETAVGGSGHAAAAAGGIGDAAQEHEPVAVAAATAPATQATQAASAAEAAATAAAEADVAKQRDAEKSTKAVEGAPHLVTKEVGDVASVEGSSTAAVRKLAEAAAAGMGESDADAAKGEDQGMGVVVHSADAAWREVFNDAEADTSDPDADADELINVGEEKDWSTTASVILATHNGAANGGGEATEVPGETAAAAAGEDQDAKRNPADGDEEGRAKEGEGQGQVDGAGQEDADSLQGEASGVDALVAIAMALADAAENDAEGPRGPESYEGVGGEQFHTANPATASDKECGSSPRGSVRDVVVTPGVLGSAKSASNWDEGEETGGGGDGMSSNNSQSRVVGRKSTAAGGLVDGALAGAEASGCPDGSPRLSCGAPDNTAEGQVVVCGPEAASVNGDRADSSTPAGDDGGRELGESAGGSGCGPEAATTADGDRAVSSEGAGDGAHESGEAAAGWCVPADPSSVELATSPAVFDGESSHNDDSWKPPLVNEGCAPEVAAESEVEAAVATTPEHSSPDLKKAEERHSTTATSESEELVPEPCPIETTGQAEVALLSEPASLSDKVAPPEEEAAVSPRQVLSQSVRHRWSLDEGQGDRVGEQEEVETGPCVKDYSGKRGAGEEAAEEMETTSSPVTVSREHHRGQAVGEKHGDGVVQEIAEDEDDRVDQRVVEKNEQEGTDVSAATATAGLFCPEMPVGGGPMEEADREATDLVACTDVQQDKQEHEGQRDDADSKEAVVEGRDDGYQRKLREVVRAPFAGSRLKDADDDEELVAAQRAAAVDSPATTTTAAQLGCEQERGEEKDADVAATAVIEGEHGEGGIELSTGIRGPVAESRASENTAERTADEDSSLLATLTLPTDEDTERDSRSQDDAQIRRTEKKERMTAVTGAEPILEEPGDKASGLAQPETTGGALPGAVSASPDEAERAPGKEKGATEKNVMGGKELCDHERGVPDEPAPLDAPALPRDEEVEGGEAPRIAESATTPSWRSPEDDAGNNNGTGSETSAGGGDCLGEATMSVAPLPASQTNPPSSGVEPRHGAAVGGEDHCFTSGVFVKGSEGAGSGGAVGFLVALKSVIQKGGSCCL